MIKSHRAEISQKENVKGEYTSDFIQEILRYRAITSFLSRMQSAGGSADKNIYILT